MHHQDHITGVVSDDGVGVGGGVVEELVDFFHCVLCGSSLLHGKGPKRSEYHQIDGTCIVQEDVDDLLEKKFPPWRGGGVIFPFGVLQPLPICGLDVGLG